MGSASDLQEMDIKGWMGVKWGWKLCPWSSWNRKSKDPPLSTFCSWGGPLKWVRACPTTFTRWSRWQATCTSGALDLIRTQPSGWVITGECSRKFLWIIKKEKREIREGKKVGKEERGEEGLNYLKAEYEINEHNLKGFLRLFFYF